MADRPDVTKLDGRHAVIGIKLPESRSLRGQVEFVERLSERLYVLASVLRTQDLHVAAHEVESAAMGLVSGAEWQRRFLDAAVSELADIDATSCPPLHDPTRKDPS